MERTVNARYIRVLLIPVLALPVMGYLWPQASLQDSASNPPPWNWPETEALSVPAPIPENMALFWPGKTPETAAQGTESNTAQNNKNSTAGRWILLGVIRQGTQLNALLQDPKQNILTLKPGDALDEQRRVSAIHPTRMIWMDNEGKTGALLLYPDPVPE